MGKRTNLINRQPIRPLGIRKPVLPKTKPFGKPSIKKPTFGQFKTKPVKKPRKGIFK